MHRRAFLAVSVLAPVSGCLEFVEDVVGENGDEITEPGDVEVVWDDLLRENPGTDEERVLVWGVVANVGERTLSYLEIRVTFYDADGEELESVIQNVEADVTEGEEWPFEVEFPRFGEDAAEVATYELEPATGV